MKKKWNLKGISAIGASALMALSLVFGIGFSDFSETDTESVNSVNNEVTETVKGEGNNSVASTYAATDDNLEYDSTAKLHYFKGGETYWYIDYTQGVKLGNKTEGVDTDIVVVTVNAGSTKGSQDNPYVINDKADWDNFVTYAATAANQTKSYVLNADLDYKQSDGSNGVIKSVKTFQGKLYGNGHRISNATISSSNALEHTLGLFCRTTGTVYVSDLILENLNVAGGAIGHVGGVIGHSDSTSLTITDVVVTGTMTCTNPSVVTGSFCTMSGHIGYGGIIGTGHGNNSTINIYKCAADVKFTASNSNKIWIGLGGIAGQLEDNSTSTMVTAINIYDCYSAEDVNYSGVANYSSTYLWTGIVGFVRRVRTATFKRCLSVVNVVSGNNSGMVPAVYCVTGGTTAFVMDNCYGYGNVKQISTNKAIPSVTYHSQSNVSGTPTNCLIYSDNKANGYFGSNIASIGTATNNSPAANLDALKTAAKGALNNPAVWANEEINKITATSRPNIVDTPILVNRIRVSYYEYKNNADAACSFVNNATEWKEVKFGDVLPEPTGNQIPTGRVFQGWTIDNTGESAPFTEVPKTIHGDNKLYAVWGIDPLETEVSIDVAGRNGSKALTYDSTKGFEIVYNQNGITLTPADLTVTGTDKSDFETWQYQWTKVGVDNPIGTSESYRVQNVKDSGKYQAVVKYRSASEPLFMGTITTDEKQATMTKAPLTLSNAKFDEGTGRPYSGAPYSTAVPTAVVTDSTGLVVVDGTTEWYNGQGKFNSDSSTKLVEKNGKWYETKSIWFELDEKYNGNYGDPDVTDDQGNVTVMNGAQFDFEFEIEYIQFIFEIENYRARPKVYVNLEYEQNYTYYNIATLFENAFKNDIGNFAGLSPVFVNGTDRWTINEYKKKTGTAYKSVKADCTLQVSFEEEKYKVTYDPRNGEDVFEEDELIGYGIRLSRPTNPENGDKLFIGWYYDVDEVGESGTTTTVTKQWNFDNDRISGETNLYARWLAADTLDKLEVEIDGSAVFEATKALDPSMIEVKATFSGTDGDNKVEQSTVLSDGQYDITYKSSDNLLHVVTDEDGNIIPTEVVISYTFTRAGKKTTKEVTLKLDLERIEIDTGKLAPYFKNTTVEKSKTDEPQTIKIPDGKVRDMFAPYLLDKGVSYEYASTLTGQPMAADEIYDVGKYQIKANFKTESADYYAPSITAILEIVGEKIALHVDWDATEFTYNGKVQIPTFTFTNPKYDNEVVTVNYEIEDTHKGTHTGDEVDRCVNAMKVSSNYSITLVLLDTGYKFDTGLDFVIVPFSIIKAKVELPEQIKPLDYMGAEYDLNNLEPELYEDYFKNFDPNLMQVGDGAKGMNVATYKAFITLKDPTCAEWVTSDKRVTMDWEIKKAQLSVYWGNDKAFEYNGEVQYPTVNRFIGLLGDDANAVNLKTDITYNVAGLKADVGGYTISMSFKSSAIWAKNYELDDTKSFSYAIVPIGSGDNIVLVIVEWTVTRFTFNNEMQYPEFKLTTQEGNEDITSELIDYLAYEGPEGAKWAGKYDLTLSIDPESEYANTYFLVGKPSVTYTILKNGDLGDNPEIDDPNKPDNSGNTGDPNRTDLSGLPLWQLIVGGVSAILFLICVAKSYGNMSKAKAAKNEAKELASQSYASYGFVPLPLLAMAAGTKFLGLEETPWTIIAFVALGLFVLSLAAVFITGKKRKAAELLLKREQARVADEKEYAREEEQRRREDEMREEQRRRDNEMKMMFAAMQQNYQQPQMQYEDMRGLIAETMQAFLPAAVQQLQALPPVQSDPNAYAQPAYGAPNYGAQQGYGAPAPAPSQYDEDLRAQLAEQKERMARQEALINELLQERQANRATPAPAYEDYEEEKDDISWLGENDEIVSLEESYGSLSDEAKRFYYEIGSYIMSKPRTSQNDGRYAVLFKYRRKTLFKLCIKGDAPVLYYPEGSGRGEVRIADSSSLDYAKSIIDRNVVRVDSELN